MAGFLLVTQAYSPYRYFKSTRIKIFDDEYRIVPGEDTKHVTVVFYGDTAKTHKMWDEHQEEIKAKLMETTGIEPAKAKFKKKNLGSDLLTFDFAGPVFLMTGFDVNTFAFGEPDPTERSFAFNEGQPDRRDSENSDDTLGADKTE